MQRRRGRLIAAGTAGIAALVAGSTWAATAGAEPDDPAPDSGASAVAQVRVLGTEAAQEAAQAAYDECSEQGHRVTVSVVGRDGALLALVRNEAAGPASIDSATGKAYASVSFRSPSGNLGQGALTNPGLLQMPGFVTLRGGLPISSDGEVIGGIGVGGAPGGDLDEACAQVGIDRIAGHL
ncbi:MAG: heme-binding protein [Acidimicrobiia bacterium]|nr:heme-binding protein [Acidimicrobiia bacterium]